MLNNACPSRITAAAGTSIGRDYTSLGDVIIIPNKRILQQFSRLHSDSIAGSNFRSLSNIPHCWPKNQPGPCFSSSVVDRPLRPTKDRWLGKLLNLPTT